MVLGTFHDIKETVREYDSKEETRELTSHAGQDEHRHRVWYWVVGLTGEKMVASIMAQWRKSYY